MRTMLRFEQLEYRRMLNADVQIIIDCIEGEGEATAEMDMNHDGHVSPVDALILMNRTPRTNPPPAPAGPPATLDTIWNQAGQTLGEVMEDTRAMSPSVLGSTNGIINSNASPLAASLIANFKAGTPADVDIDALTTRDRIAYARGISGTGGCDHTIIGNCRRMMAV